MGITNTISLLGGLGFFLFGMSLLGEGLKRVAGSKLEIILEKLTSTTFRGVLLGALVTAVIQSSSATTVMVVGFVNSGIMKLANAVGIIMGANIGTTATGWILVLAGMEGSGGFSSATIFAFVAFIGIILYFFCKKQNLKNVGMILLALSVLMNGMQSMSGAMAPLKESPAFLNFIAAVSNPLVAMVVGIAVTAVIQSCSASIGILQALSVTGIIGYDVAIPMVIGMCIGACAPVLLSAIGANLNGKRTALVYLIFNLSGATLLMIPFYIGNAFVHFEFMALPATSLGIAIINTIFKVAATILLIPFSGLMVKLVTWIVKDKSESGEEEYEENLLDERFLNYPALALEQSSKTMDQMSDTAFRNIHSSIDLLGTYKQETFDKIMSREDKVDRFEDRLGSYLVRLHAKPLSDGENLVSARYLNYLTNVERISDHSVKIAELALELHEKKIAFSPQALHDLTIYIDAVKEVCRLTQESMENMDCILAGKVNPLAEVINLMAKDLKKGHIQRVQNGQCTLELGFIFNDLLGNFERVSAHCSNIAITILESQDPHLREHDYIGSLDRRNQNTYELQLQFYKNQYWEKIGKETALKTM
ncbi:MAG: Na/Pi cotransporter family protein [Lachnoclostridium sp.]|nr:Na/Pi cotransporter family protein [Lachnoclostridium sp.]